MAHGLPDFYRGVDIAYQALSEMITRPKYGGAQLSYGSVQVSPDVETALTSISGKGMVYGGILSVTHTSTQKDGEPRLYVDGNLITNAKFYALNGANINVENAQPFYERLYDDTNFDYVVALSRGITFEESLEARYREHNSSDPHVTTWITYALI